MRVPWKQQLLPCPAHSCCMDLALWVTTSCPALTFRCVGMLKVALGSGMCKSLQASAWALTQSGQGRWREGVGSGQSCFLETFQMRPGL